MPNKKNKSNKSKRGGKRGQQQQKRRGKVLQLPKIRKRGDECPDEVMALLEVCYFKSDWSEVKQPPPKDDCPI